MPAEQGNNTLDSKDADSKNIRKLGNDLATDVFSLETPQFGTGVSSGIDLNMLLNSGVPNTAEIIQKCLSVNPFDLKFREANLQINQGQPSVGKSTLLGTSPVSSGLSTVLKLSSFSQSPEIFSNISVLTADIESELRKKLRENGLLSDKPIVDGESPRPAPSTADVLNAVLDMNMNQIEASAAANSISLVAPNFVSALKSSAVSSTSYNSNLLNLPNVSSSGVTLSNSTQSSNQFAHANVLTDSHASHINPLKRELSASLGSLDKIHHQQALPPFNYTASGSMSFQQQQQQQSNLDLERLIPNMQQTYKTHLESQVSPIARPHSSNADLLKPPPQIAVVDTSISSNESSTKTWSLLEMKPHSVENVSTSPNVASSKSDDKSTRQNNVNQGIKDKSTRRYTKADLQSSRNMDAQVTSTKGGRGRRSLISDIPPDERRLTILERNKAAAVRYRKRKKEEHDDMLTKVQRLEQDKSSLETQNNVLRRELERLSSLLQIRSNTSQCTSCGRTPTMSLGNLVNSSLPDDYCPNDASSFGVVRAQTGGPGGH